MEKAIMKFGTPTKEKTNNNTSHGASPLPTSAKWCMRHGSCKHSTAECKAFKNNLPPRENLNKTSSSYVLKTPLPPLTGIILKGEVDSKSALLQLDSGASMSYISHQKAVDLDLEKKRTKMDKPVKFTTAKGDNLYIQYKIPCIFTFEQLPAKKS